MEGNERELRPHDPPLPATRFQVQVYEVVEGADPTTHILICSGDDRNVTNRESARVASGRGGRIRKGLLPPIDRGCWGIEVNTSKEVRSRSLNPRFGDDATRFERRRFIVQMINNVVEDLSPGAQHGSSGKTIVKLSLKKITIEPPWDFRGEPDFYPKVRLR
jgi:hypothetical protein